MLSLVACAALPAANISVKSDSDQLIMPKLFVLGCGGIYGFHGLITRASVREKILTFPVVWLPIIFFLLFCVAPFSIMPLRSLASLTTYVAVFLMTVTALDNFGEKKTIELIQIGLVAFVAGSWIAYLAFPSVGLFAESTAHGYFYRMGGLGHPNVLGQIAAFTGIVSVVLFFESQTNRYRNGIFAMLALGALVNCYSRTSIFAFLVSVFVAYRQRFLRRKYMFVYGICIAATLLAFLVAATQYDLISVFESKLSVFAKSEDTSEFTTATGRSDIWIHAIDLIRERIIFGYGASVQKYYFQDHSFHTHNMLLNIAFCGGITPLIAAMCMFFGRLVSLWQERDPLPTAIVVFVMINGIFEQILFTKLGAAPMILWTLVLVWPLLQSKSKSCNRTSNRISTRFLRMEAPC